MMASLSPGAVRRFSAALVVAATPLVSHTAQAAPLPLPQSRQEGQARPVAGDDTAIVHRELRKAITDFQDNWRKVWKKVEIKRHDPINLPQIRGWGVRTDGVIEGETWAGDRELMNLTPELRRYLAVLCNVDSPTDEQIEYLKARKGNDIGAHVGIAAPLGRNSRGAPTNIRATAFQSELSFLTPRMIRPTPNYGAICPAWIPESERLPLDEGEAIDLALPPASREPLRRERELLITTLANAKAKYPADEWIIGQHLRFVIDQRSPSRALQAARDCKGSQAFCSMMLGLALEVADRQLDAEATFRVADSLATTKAARPDSAGCIHSETLMLLSPGDRDEVQRGTCEAQREFVQRMWWLADPMWSIPGNERYTAHEARRAHASLRSVLDRDERYTWAKLGGGEAFRELVVRYGWPGYTYWPGNQLEEEINKVRENGLRPRFLFPPYTAVEYSSDRTALIPKIDAVKDPFNAKQNHWDLRLREGSSLDQWWPQEHMMLWMQLHPLEPGQQAQWRRDSTVVFGMVVDNPLFSLDTAAKGPSTAALVASTSANDIRVLWRSALLSGEVLRMRGEFPSTPVVISAEVQARTQREPAQRLRFGLRPVPSLRDMKANEVAMSEPSFLRVVSRDDVLPNNLDAASQFMTGSLDFLRTEQLALFWESYGFQPDDSVDFLLRVNRADDVNLARRLGSALGVVSGLRDSVTIKWSEPVAAAGASVLRGPKTVLGRSVALDLKALPAGTYVVSVEMRSTGGRVARSEREFILR